MRSALYYPNTALDENLLKTSLLLWDEVHVIVPWPEFEPYYESRDARDAFSLVGRCRCPSDEEKSQVHELVEDFVTRPLPRAFTYRSNSPEIHGVYAEKVLPDTWRVLREAGLTGERQGSINHPMNEPTALSLMNIIADCCAGDSLARITDQSLAYAALAGLFIDESPVAIPSLGIREELVPVTLSIASTDDLPLKKLVDLRKREHAGSDGHLIRDLRHRFVQRLESQVTQLSVIKAQEDAKELKRQFAQDMVDDYRDLREALKLEAQQLLGTKELITVCLGAGVVAAAVAPIPVANVFTVGGAVATIGGLLATRAKFVSKRQQILRDHPMSYLYEAVGGMRL
jgi:hypothetical protein